MNYTLPVLLVLGIFGILIHNLIKMDEINKKENGEFKFSKYLKIERFSIAISICVVIVAVIVSQEIKQLEQVGKWLGLGFIAIGYMAQSIIVKFMGKAEKVLQ
jgi:heme/copper-type cytochrome/quinol oxidase subunit 2